MDEAKRKKYYFARRCWLLRDEKTPAGQIPWPEHFAQMYEQSLEDYMAECQKLNVKQQVIEYETRKFGHSPLQKDGA